MRLAKRYICLLIILTSIFWISVDFFVVLWEKKVNFSITNSDQSIISVSRHGLDSSLAVENNFVNIKYFETFYKPILNPDASSAGMNGSLVENPRSEKEQEDKSIHDYGFNELSSSKISLERTIPDNRDKM